jgi:hypothetical protein
MYVVKLIFVPSVSDISSDVYEVDELESLNSGGNSHGTLPFQVWAYIWIVIVGHFFEYISVFFRKTYISLISLHFTANALSSFHSKIVYWLNLFIIFLNLFSYKFTVTIQNSKIHFCINSICSGQFPIREQTN